MSSIVRNSQYYKFCIYGFLKNLRFFDAFLILFLVEKGLPFTQIGILYAIRQLCVNLFEIPSGIIADTYGRKNSLAGSLAIYILSFVVFYFSGDFWFFLAAFILYGVGDAFRSGTHKGMIMDYLQKKHWEDQKISYYGHTRSWSQKGSALSSIVAGIIVFYSGKYASIFLYSIVPYALNFLLILTYPGDLNRSVKTNEGKKRRGWKNTYGDFLRSLQEPGVLKLINSAALHSAFLQAVKDYIQLVMVQLALIIPFLYQMEDEKRNGLVIGVLYFCIYLLTSGASKYASRLVAGGRDIIPALTLLAGLLLGFFSGIFFIGGFWILSFLAFVGIYLVENLRKPVLTGYLADHVPNKILTSVISAQSLLKTVMTALLAFLFGILADRFNIGAALIIISGTLGLLTIVINLSTRIRKNGTRP